MRHLPTQRSGINAVDQAFSRFSFGFKKTADAALDWIISPTLLADKFVRMDEGEILIFLQEDMPNRYVQPDDAWIKELEANLEELRRKKLDRAGKPSDAEQPSRPFNPPNAGSPSLAELTAMRRHAGTAVQQNGRIPQETYL